MLFENIGETFLGIAFVEMKHSTVWAILSDNWVGA